MVQRFRKRETDEYRGRGNMNDAHCPACGNVMHVDSFTHKPYCPSCGKTLTEISAPKPFTMTIDRSRLKSEPEAPAAEVEKAAALVRDEHYSEALEILNGLKKNNLSSSPVILLSMLCGYHVRSTEELLRKVSSSPMSIQILVTRPDWNRLAEYQFAKENQFVVHVLEYCSLCLRLSGTDINEIRQKISSRQGKGKRYSSTLAQLDAEDSHNNERTNAISEAIKPTERSILNLYGDADDDMMYTRPLGDSLIYVSDDPDVNLALDIFDLFFTGNDVVYNPFSHTRKYNYDLRNAPPPKQRIYREDEKKKKDILTITVNENEQILTPDDMRTRQEELLKIISQEEKQILP